MNHQVHDQWKVIRSNAGDSGAGDEAGLHLDFFCDKYMIDTAHRESPEPGPLRNMVVEFILGVV